MRLLDGDPGLEPPVGFNPTLTAIFEFVAAGFKRIFHGGGNPELRGPPNKCSVKSLGGDADYGVNHAVHALRFPDNLRITLETFLP